MATTFTNGSSYDGKVVGGLFRETFREVDAIKNGAFSFYENVNNKIKVKKLATTNGRTLYSCGFTPTGSITLAEKEIETKKFKDQFQICKEDWRATHWEEALGASAHNTAFPSEVLDAIVQDKLERNADAFSEEVWVGTGDDSSGAEQILGLLPQFEAVGSGVIKVDGDAITESNVEAEIKKALAAVPAKLQGKKNLKVSVASNVAQAYNFYLLSKGITNGLGGNANASLVFGNYTLVEDKGLPADSIVIADPENLVFATGLMADHNSIEVNDEDAIGLQTGQIRGTMIYNAGLGFVYGAEIVYYRPDPTP